MCFIIKLFIHQKENIPTTCNIVYFGSWRCLYQYKDVPSSLLFWCTFALHSLLWIHTDWILSIYANYALHSLLTVDRWYTTYFFVFGDIFRFFPLKSVSPLYHNTKSQQRNYRSVNIIIQFSLNEANFCFKIFKLGRNNIFRLSN